MKRLLLIAVLASACSAQSGPVSLPFKTAGSLMLVEIQINDHKAVALLDTGATTAFINTGGTAGLHQVIGSHGFVGEGEVLHVGLKIGNRVFLDFPVLSTNLGDVSKRIGSHIDAVVGQSVLSQFSSVKIDYAHKTLELE